MKPRQVRVKEMSESKPPNKCRKSSKDAVETGGEAVSPGRARGVSDYCAGGNRHEGGMTLAQASLWNVGTCLPM